MLGPTYDPVGALQSTRNEVMQRLDDKKLPGYSRGPRKLATVFRRDQPVFSSRQKRGTGKIKHKVTLGKLVTIKADCFCLCTQTCAV